MPAGKRAELNIVASTRKTCRRAQHAALRYSIGKVTVQNLKAKKTWTMRYATNNSAQWVSFKSERLAFPQATSWDDTILYLSLDDVLNIEETSVHGEVEIVLLTEKPYNTEGTVGITRRFSVKAYVDFDMGSGQSFISKPIVPPSWQNCNQRLNAPCS